MIIFAATVMNNVYKGKAKYILAPVVMLLLITGSATSRAIHFPLQKNIYTADSLPPISIDTIPRKTLQADTSTNDSSKKVLLQNKLTDTSITEVKTDTFHIKASKDSLDGPVTYHADDSVVMDIPNKKIILYGKESKTKYKDNELTAPGIEFDQGNNLVTAALKKDSVGNVIAYPVFNQGTLKTVSDTIKFNMKTGKGLTKGSYTQQGEIFIYGEKIKKVSPDVFYAYRGRFTTCDLDTPHFAFVSKKIKFINKKMAITGPVHLEFEGVPVPIYLPFGIFPLIQGKHSGIIAPTFTVDQQLGLALQGLGYYKILSDNWDATVTGTIYSYGSWSISPRSTYYKRYHYRGNFSINYQNLKHAFSGDPDYSVSKTFQINWSHSMDSKARPGVSFSANVSAGSSQYNSQVPGNPVQNFNNQLQSSIQYAKVWKDKPFNIAISANHNQDAVSKTFNVTLPDVAFNVNTLYPFRRKEPVGTLKWYENIGVALNSDARSTTTFSDDSTIVSRTSVGKQVINNLQWGAQHNVPISLSLPPIGALQIAPSISYQERWYQQKLIQKWDAANNKLDSTLQKGFYSARMMTFGIGLSTRIFGMVTFKKNSKIQAIRHEVRPFINFSYVPDMNSQYYYNLRYDSVGDIRRASVFEGKNLYGGAFSETKFAGISFGIDNNIQMKVLNPKDTGENAVKKITLIDGLSIGGSYNFLLDSFALSTLSVSARSNLFNKINITASGNLDPYQLDSFGRRINQVVWKQKIFTLGRLTNASISLSTQFKGGDSKNKVSGGRTLPTGAYDPSSGLPPDQYQAEMGYINSNPAEFTDFNIPWSVNLQYSFNYSRTPIYPPAFATLKTLTQSATFSGTLGLSAKWQVSLNTSYNITTGQLGYWSLTLARDMHCWQMGISINNSSYSRSFSITISPKSALLKDLKLNRARSFYNNY